jgi:polyisoprenyl-teichoic acid--peptidoglycan teichoic acid transferase
VIKRAILLMLFVGVVIGVVPNVGGNDATGLSSSIAIGRVHEQWQPQKGKIFALVVGSDARSGNPNLRADAIHIAGINTRTMRGGILNFPRDSWVEIPGSGSAKINEALYRGGPELLARTLEDITGIRIDLWVVVGFEGFEDIVRDIGPIPMRFARPISDPGGSGANISPGAQKLGPNDALAYVRTRKAFSGGDVARTRNQAHFLLAMLRKLRTDVEERPSELLRWIAVARREARLNISPQEMFRLAVVTSQVHPSDIDNVTVPVSLGSVGAASVVFIQPGATHLYRHFKKYASF